MIKHLHKRIEALESVNNAGAEHITINVTFVGKEHIQHPERFTKKLMKTETNEHSTMNYFTLERA